MAEAASSRTFYSFSAEQRTETVRMAVQERRTLIERWQALDALEAAPWNERAACAASMLESQHSVADIGCGDMQLEKHLPASCRYIPIDVVARDQRTIIVDLNVDCLPQVSASSYAVLGVLEYLFEPERLLDCLNGTLVVRYNPINFNASHREEHGWVNHYTQQEFESNMHGRGWSKKETCRLDNQLLWKFLR